MKVSQEEAGRAAVCADGAGSLGAAPHAQLPPAGARSTAAATQDEGHLYEPFRAPRCSLFPEEGKLRPNGAAKLPQALPLTRH